MKHVVVNNGHGGDAGSYDSGAIGADGTQEHLFIEKELSPEVVGELRNLGYKVTVVEQHHSFGELVPMINKLKPDVIVSLHFNCFNGVATGTEVLYYQKSKKSKLLAEITDKKVVGVLGLADRGAKGLLSGRGVGLLKGTDAPCVIVEGFFGDNARDLAVARKNIKGFGKAIAQSVDEWFKKV
jgi:N-acetylmuramoyl-L-alanine amidase